VADDNGDNGSQMSTGVAVDADLESFALVVRVGPEAEEEPLRRAVDASAAQRPAAVVLDLKRLAQSSRLIRDASLVGDLGRLCARHAVPLVVVPLLAATLAATVTPAASALPSPAGFPDVQNALAALPRRGTPDSRTLTLAAVETAPARSRTVVEEELTAWGMEHLMFPAQLVASELVSNAVLHGAPPVGLMVRRMETGLLIGVHDCSGTPPVPSTEDPSDVDSQGGRGLVIVPAVARQWGTLLGTDEKIVWADIADPTAGTS
jgi:hypothetical protein